MHDISSALFFTENIAVFVTAAVVAGILALVWFYPFRLLFTTVHELGHVIASKLTGVGVKGFEVYFSPKNGTRGVTEREEESVEDADLRYIISAGYMGTALFTTGLILLTGFPTRAPYAITFIALLFFFSALIYGKKFSTFAISFGMAIFLIWAAWFAPLLGSIFILNLIAVMGIIRAFKDWHNITDLARNEPYGGNDAAKMAAITKGSPLFWARVWSYSTFLMIGIALWFVWLRPLGNFVKVA